MWTIEKFISLRKTLPRRALATVQPRREGEVVDDELGRNSDRRIQPGTLLRGRGGRGNALLRSRRVPRLPSQHMANQVDDHQRRRLANDGTPLVPVVG